MEEFSKLIVSFSAPNDTVSTHTIYCKRHSVKTWSSDTPNEQTLFSLGWPPYVDGDSLAALFSRAGHVVRVFLQSKPGPVGSPVDNSCFMVAYIVMSNKSEVTSALKLCTSGVPIPCELSDNVGLKKWCKQYVNSRPKLDSMESSVAMVMTDYDKKVEVAKREREKASQPDKDGWITVTRKSHKRKAAAEETGRKRKKKQELVNFYSWQLRETQREEIARLREKYEEDKLRVAEMKAKRKFKPF